MTLCLQTFVDALGRRRRQEALQTSASQQEVAVDHAFSHAGSDEYKTRKQLCMVCQPQTVVE